MARTGELFLESCEQAWTAQLEVDVEHHEVGLREVDLARVEVSLAGFRHGIAGLAADGLDQLAERPVALDEKEPLSSPLPPGSLRAPVALSRLRRASLN